MVLSETEAIIIGSIVGIAILIVFGLILWYLCHRSNSETPSTAKYSQVPQNGLKETMNEDAELGKLSNGESIQNTQDETQTMHESEVMPEPDMHVSSDHHPSNDVATTVIQSNHTIEVTLESDEVGAASEINLNQNDEKKQSDFVKEKESKTVNTAANADTTKTVHDKHGDDVPCNICDQHGTEQKSESVFGESQSPINIVTKTQCGKTKIMADEEFKSNPLKFNYPEQVKNCTIMNNGHTVQINIGEENQCTLHIHGKIYTLRQFHFHTPSEHTFDDKQYEMEMHLVHTNEENEIAVLGFIFTTQQKRSKPSLTLSKSRMHLVLTENPKKNINASLKKRISSLSPMKELQEIDDESDDDGIETDSDWESEQEQEVEKKPMIRNNYNAVDQNQGNDFLSQFWDQLPLEKTTEDIPLKKPLSFDYLFETASNNFSKNVNTNEIDIDMELFEYMGSLTTPPYTEGVQWLVSKRTHFLNNKQLYKLSACWGHKNNARETQKYFGRMVSLRSKSSLKVI